MSQSAYTPATGPQGEGKRQAYGVRWVEYINPEGHVVAVEGASPNDGLGVPWPVTDSGCGSLRSDTNNSRGLRIVPEIKLVQYVDDQGVSVARDMDNCSIGNGPQMRIAAPTPLGGYFLKTTLTCDLERIVDMVVASGADSVIFSTVSVCGDVISWLRRDPRFLRKIQYSSGRPSSSETQRHLPACGIRSMTGSASHCIIRLEPVRDVDIAAARADPQIRRVVRSPW